MSQHHEYVIGFMAMDSKFPTFTPDALLSNLLLYQLLACYIALVYTAVVLAGLLLGWVPSGNPDLLFSPPWWVSLATLVVIAPTVLPVRRLLRSHINDLIYGQHDDPYALISEVNALLQAMSAPQMSLPRVTETIARALKLPYVAIAVARPAADPGPPLRFEFGAQTARSEITSLPLVYLDKPLGELAVGARRANETLSESDRELLGDVARQIGIALHVVQLSADLQASRERLVIGREEERRRIRNDLHDGLGPTLSSLQLQLGAMRGLIRQKPDEAEAIANELRDDLRQATAEIRQLVYDLRPPLLDELGLVEAIKGLRVQGSGMSLEVAAPELMPKLSAALEVAIYRIATEAILNALRHAQATRCVVCFEMVQGMIKVSVADNGKSLPEAPLAGVGFASMRERAAELGGTVSILPGRAGGVEVVAQFPLAA